MNNHDKMLYIPLALNAARRQIINRLETEASLFTGNVAYVITD